MFACNAGEKGWKEGRQESLGRRLEGDDDYKTREYSCGVDIDCDNRGPG